MSQNSSKFPFYVHPMDQKRSVRIIKEAKAEIKKLESHRPTTPFINSQIGFYNDKFSRPSSCASIRSLNYELEENPHVFCRKLSTIKNSKVEGGDVKLEPIVTKSVLKSRRSSISSLKISGEAVFPGFPPLLCENKNKCPSAKKQTGNGTENNIRCENEQLLGHEYYSKDLVELGSLHSLDLRCDLSPLKNKKPLSLNEENVGDNISNELQDFFPFLEKYIRLGRKLNEEDAVTVIKKLYRLLEEKCGFFLLHDKRTSLLKLLFKLLDSHFPVLSLNIVKLLLQMRIKEKNLSSCFRLVLRLMKDEKVDLNAYQLVESIFEVLNNTSVSKNSEAVLYGIKISKILLCSQKLEIQLSEMCIHILIYQLSELNLLFSKESWDSNAMDILALIVSTFRYLIEDDVLWKFLVKVETLTEILNVLVTCSQSTETVQIVVRLISKIIDKEEGCAALSQCSQNLLLPLLTLSETYRHHIEVTLQIAFIIGSLISFDEKIALAFVNSTHFTSTITVIGVYIDEHLKIKDSISDCFKSQNLVSCGDRNWRVDIFQVILKILCIWANVCFHPEAGLYLAKCQEVVYHLLAIIAAYKETENAFDRNTVLHSFVVVVGNISYYFECDSELSIKTTECVVPLLDGSYPNEVRFEAANVIRNLTRLPDVRAYIQEHALLSAFIKLLCEDNKEFCIGAYGTITNLLIDESSRQIFYEEQGVTRILHKLHLCSDRDWKTSALLCQILWNYCGGENAEIISISDKESQHLVKFLSYSTHHDKENMFEKKDTNFYTEWKSVFCPVALRLLAMLRSKHVAL